MSVELAFGNFGRRFYDGVGGYVVKIVQGLIGNGGGAFDNP